ncbi:MAG: phage tail tape measure protein [Elusimicrobia bacterium]|nr:phage tail tape measure protein [Elusimicrobiota bacterium]
MADSMRVALQFTAVDAASAAVEQLRARIDRLGDSGKQLQKDFSRVQGDFISGLKGLGIAWGGLKLMRPGLEFAADMEDAGVRLKLSLADSGKSAAAMNQEFNRLKLSAIEVGRRVGLTAVEMQQVQKQLVQRGFTLGDISGQEGLAARAAAFARISGASAESVAELGEMFRQQFGASTSAIGESLDFMSRLNLEAKLPGIAQGLQSMGTQAGAMKIPMKDAIAALTVLEHVGLRAGPAFGTFLGNLKPGYRTTQAAWMRQYDLSFYENGRFIGLARTQKLLQDRLGNYQGDRAKLLENIFGEGWKVAESFINSKESLSEINDVAVRGKSVFEKNDALAKSMAASFKEASISLKEMLAAPFEKVTAPLATAARGMGSATNWAGDLVRKHDSLAYGIAGLGGATVLGAGAWGITKLARSALGFTGLMRGAGALVGGTMVGTGLQKATGVTPVFVVNMPGALGLAASAGAGGLVDKFGKPLVSAAGAVAGTFLTRAALGTALGAVGSVALPALAIGAGLAGGYAFGKYVINPAIDQAGKAWDEWNEKPFNEERLSAATPQVKNDIKLELHFDADCRLKRSVSDNLNTTISAPRGDHK